MGSSFVICDQEEGYAAALAAFLMRKRNWRFRSGSVRMRIRREEMEKDRPADILVISDACPRARERNFMPETFLY